MTVFTDKPDSDMELSWEDGIGHIPDDTMMHFRRVGAAEWQDMRKVREVDIVSAERITKVEFDVHAERYAMSPPR